MQALVDVLRPVQRVTHQRTANRHQVVHGVRAVLRHAQRLQVGEVEVHLRGRLGLGRQLKDHSHAVDHEFLAGTGDVFGRSQQRRRANRHRRAQPAVDVTARPGRQQRPELIGGASCHGRPCDDVLTDGLAHEVLGRDDPALAGIHLGAGRHPEHAAKVIGMRVGVDDGGDGSCFDVFVYQVQRGSSSVLARQRVDDDPAFLAADESDVGDVVAAHLPHTVRHFEQAVVRVEHRVAPEIGVHRVGGRRVAAQEVVGSDVEHLSAVRADDGRLRQRSDVSAANPLQV